MYLNVLYNRHNLAMRTIPGWQLILCAVTRLTISLISNFNTVISINCKIPIPLCFVIISCLKLNNSQNVVIVYYGRKL